MRADWLVPDGSLLQFSRPDWFLLLLDRLSKEERSMIILIFWRNWRDHNSITHGGGRLSIDASACALRALQRTFFRKQLNIIDDMKRKFPLNIFAGKQKQKVPMEKQTPKLVWQPPEEGWIKINVDGSYVKVTGEASIGLSFGITRGMSFSLHGDTCFSAPRWKKQSFLHVRKACGWLINGVMAQ